MKLIVFTKKGFKPAQDIVFELEKQGHEVSVVTYSIPDTKMPKQFDLGISIHYQFILKKDVIDSFKYGVINIHPSFLPYGRGADPIIWGIFNNEPLGVSIHWIDEGIDTGNVLYRTPVKMIGLETAEELYNRVTSGYKNIFFWFWGWFEESLKKGIVPSGMSQSEMTSENPNPVTKKRKDLKNIGVINDKYLNTLLALSNSDYWNFTAVADDGHEYKAKIIVMIGDRND